MAAPTTPTNVVLDNQSGDTLMLVSSTYEGVPNVIKSGASPSEFPQDTELSVIASVVYAVGNIATWVVVWTANNEVATSVLPPGTPLIWKDIWNKLQRDGAIDSYRTSYGWEYNSTVEIKSDGDAQTLSVIISYDPISKLK
ncbi:uncharacterized protein LOC120170656 [Hibiscus syriacus]|uniref:uncharacterized protein LOC120170656 n=1 Tax=Hibiscus syriacus TaxID=106335 RepID=UPI0019227271|nr:uncharacterized protein LOC120170656 [Hibiscus syriacus]